VKCRERQNYQAHHKFHGNAEEQTADQRIFGKSKVANFRDSALSRASHAPQRISAEVFNR
jgi:hypothetical protein